jgi:hypothetical protein
MKDYIEIYKPINPIDFIGHFKFIIDFKTFLKLNSKFDKPILCIGYSGIGKTSLLKLLFKEMNFNFKEIIYSNSYKIEIDNYLNNKTIDDFFKKNKKLLFFDDLETFLCDKHFINYFINLKKNTNIPIICIINKLYNRKFNDLKKKSKVFYISRPPFDKCYKYIINILNNENILITENFIEDIKNYIKKNNNNIKSILINLDNFINNKNYNNLIDNTFNDIDLFDIINKLFTRTYTIRELDKIVYNDISLITMLLHENIIKHYQNRILKKNNENNKIIINEYYNIIDNICTGDIIEKYIYINNDWNLYKLTSIIKIFPLNNYINKYKINNNTVIQNNFTKILTKYSLKCNYDKKIIQYSNNLHLSKIYYNIVIQNIIFYLKNNNINKNYLEEIKKNYYIINKDIIEIFKKYNKEFNLINNEIINKLK